MNIFEIFMKICKYMVKAGDSIESEHDNFEIFINISQ